MVNAVMIFLIFQLIGEVTIRTLSLPVPGPVVGMLLLFLVLLIRDPLVETVEPTSQFILQHLTLLYVPAAVGVMVHLSLIQNEGLPLVVSVVGGTIITIVVTAVSMRFLMGKFAQKSQG